MVQDKFKDDYAPPSPNMPSADSDTHADQSQVLPDDEAKNNAGTIGRSTLPKKIRLREKPVSNGLTRSELKHLADAMRTLDLVRPELRMAQDVMRMSVAGDAIRSATHQMAWTQAAQVPSELVTFSAESHRRITDLCAGNRAIIRFANQQQAWVSKILQSTQAPMFGDMLRPSVGLETTRVMELLNNGLSRNLFPTLLQVDRVLAEKFGTPPLYNATSALRRSIGKSASPYSDVRPRARDSTHHRHGHASANTRANNGLPIGPTGRAVSGQSLGALMADIRMLSHQHGITEDAVCDIIDTMHRRGSGGGAGISAMLKSRDLHNKEHRSTNRQELGPHARGVPHATVYFANGKVAEIFETEYKELVADKGDIDIIFDGCACVVHKRKARGVPHQRAILSRGEFAIIRDYILHPGWHTPEDFLSHVSSVEAAYKGFTRARLKADIMTGRHDYLLFETGPADPGKPRLYRFNPPKEINWLLVDRYVPATS